MRAEPAVDRFWAKVDPTGECWLWTATLDCEGYGRLRVGPKIVQAHRFSYELHVGPIPDGLVIDHLCRVRHCVNPSHLEPVSDRVNILRGESLSASRARQTHCKRGHEFTPENTYRWRDARICRTCRSQYVRAS